MNKYVIIAAGGSGTRMQSELPKQFLLLQNKPLLCHTIEKFQLAFEDIKTILAVPLDYIEYTKDLLKKYHLVKDITIIEGGKTRYHSVQNGVQQIKETEAIIFVHDAARCLVSIDLIKKCYNAALQFGNAIPAISISDSLRIINENGNAIMDRDKIRSIQTPQTFVADSLQKAFTQNYKPSFTDEASVVEELGIAINLIEGEQNNIKITTPMDLKTAEVLINN